MRLSRWITILFAVGVLIVQVPVVAAEETDPADISFNELGLQNKEGAAAGIVIGAVTLDGKNYQQIGVRADIPFGKLGFGLDIQLLLDEEGSVREEDWDELEDYIDMIYYIRWDQKGAPFYAKVGGLDYSYIGYSNVINGYSNMVEYPDYKRLGMEMSFHTERFEGELLINDYKELTEDEPGMLIGTRLAFKPFWKFEIGATVATDLNEYNGLRDTDDDGYPDEVDDFPYDDTLVTEKEELQQLGATDSTIQNLIDIGKLEDVDRTDLTDYSKLKSDLTIWSLDAGIPIVEGEFFKMDLYSAYTDIVDYGWGVTAPGFRTMFGNFLTFVAEYRFQSEEFLYGYFNNTYELERAQYFDDGTGTGTKIVRTKQETLKDVTEEMDGYLTGLSINLMNFVRLTGQYQDMKGDTIERKSVNGEALINDGAVSFLPMIKGYYVQNNVESLSEWRTPSTITGAIVQYNVGAVTLSFDNRYTFVDKNGDGVIEGDDETIKTISVSSTVTF